MTDQTTPADSAPPTAVAALASGMLLLASIAELVFVDSPVDAAPALPAMVTFFWVGFVPFLLACSLGRRLSAGPRRLRRAAFWAPLFVGIAVGLGGGVLAGAVELSVLGAALFGATAFASIAPRLLPTLRETPTATLAPAGVLGVIVAAACGASTRDVFEATNPIALALPVVVGMATVVGQILHQGLLRRSRALAKAVTGVILLGGGAAVVWLAAWLPELNASLKLLVAWCLAFALSVFADPWMRGRRLPRAAAPVAVIAAVVVGLAAVALPIPERFAGLDPRSVAASGVTLLSAPSDRDRDGFYARAVGGNDCDDLDPRAHPLAATLAGNCLPELADQAAAPAATIVSVPHVLLVIVDALRADHVSGAERLASYPALERLASESVRFQQAYAPGNSTFTSLPSLLSGVSPQLVLGAISAADPKPYDQLMRGRWIFDDTDRCTALIVAAHEETSWLFDLYPSDVDTRVTETRVDENNHGSWTVPPAVESALAKCAGRPSLFAIYMDDPHLEGIAGHACFGGETGGEDCYRDEIKAVDAALGQVFAAYEARGIWGQTAVIFTSDHGEALGERGHHGHTSNVFEEQVRVPLWLRRPGSPPGTVVAPVSGLSVPVTVRGLAGASLGRAVYPPLTSVSEGEPGPPPVMTSSTGRVKLGWTSPVTAMRVGDHKLVHQWATNRSALFALDADPGELVDLASTEPARVRELEAQLFAIERKLLLAPRE